MKDKSGRKTEQKRTEVDSACRLNVARHDWIATYDSLNAFISRKKKGRNKGRRPQVEKKKLVLSPNVSDSAMDDLWRALSSDVIGRHVGFLE